MHATDKQKAWLVVGALAVIGYHVPIVVTILFWTLIAAGIGWTVWVLNEEL